MVYMGSMTSCVFPFLEYFHSMSCSYLLPRNNVGSLVRWPSGIVV